MSSLTTTLNASLVAGDAARLAQAQQLRAQEDAATQLRTGSGRGLPTNSTITASYTYAVASDGSLTPTEARITTQIDADAAKQQKTNKQASRDAEDGSAGLRSITRPRVDLSPSDELTVFANAGKNDGNEQHRSPSAPSAQAPVVQTTDTVELPATTAIVTLAAQAQQAAAELYARNSNAVYNVNPLVDQAA